MKMHDPEQDPDVRRIAPVIAHKLWGKSDAASLTASQRRQVRNFTVDILKALHLVKTKQSSNP